MNHDCAQNRDENLLYLAASQGYFSRVGLWRRLQILLVVILPTGIAIFGATQRDPNFIVPFVGFVSVIIDAGLFLPRISENRYRAAQLAEMFDAKILGAQPSKVRLWNAPSDENVHDAAQAYLTRPGAREELRTWYTERLDELALPAAQILCQRISCSWDERLREQYVPWLGILIVIVVLLLILIFGEMDWSVPALVTNVLFPSTPAIAWVIREYIDHKGAQRHKQQLRHAIEDLWSRLVRSHHEDNDNERERDAVQGMHFMYRSIHPSVPGWLSRRNRDRQRQVFRTTIDAYVNDAVTRGLGAGPRAASSYTEGD